MNATGTQLERIRQKRPVTQREVMLHDDSVIFSTTDLRGIIISANDTFVEISGYSREELIGAPHNILRHPDVPPAVFKNLWDTIQAGKPWLGIVKNRCKNGDHYWVEAFVTPLTSHGVVTGYQSVRVMAERRLIDRAAALYEAVWAGRASTLSVFYPRRWPAHRQALSAFLLLTTLLTVIQAVVSVQGGLPVWPALVTAGTGFVFSLAAARGIGRWMASLTARARAFAGNPIMQELFMGSLDEIGELQYESRILKARNRTALARLAEYGGTLSSTAEGQSADAEILAEAVARQERATQSLAAAITELNASIQDVARSSQQASGAATQSACRIDASVGETTGILSDIRILASAMEQTATDMDELAEKSEAITRTLEDVHVIARQTNLLAVNAAIEAKQARGGSNGFSVIVREIRELSNRTRQNAQLIGATVDELSAAAHKARKTSYEGTEKALEVASRSTRVGQALEEIRRSVSLISAESQDVSSAARDQALAVGDVDQSVARLTLEGQSNSTIALNLKSSASRLLAMSAELTDMMRQFKL